MTTWGRFAIVATAAALLGASGVLGCASAKSGGAPAQTPSPAPAAPTTEGPATNGATSITTTTTGATGGAAPPPAATATPTLVDPLRAAQSGFDDSAQAFAAAGSDCARMCKALASMQRSAEHLCALTEGGGELDRRRCADAKGRVDDASDRVQSSCGGCAP